MGTVAIWDLPRSTVPIPDLQRNQERVASDGSLLYRRKRKELGPSAAVSADHAATFRCRIADRENVSLYEVQPIAKTIMISRPSAAGRVSATMADRTRLLLSMLEECNGDIRRTWLWALRNFVASQDSYRAFDDILSHSWLQEIQRPLDRNPLLGLSIAELSVLYEFLLSARSMKAKRKNGQFFTPDDVAIFMADRALTFPEGTWLDPCCGVGNLSYWLVARAKSSEEFLLEHCKFADIDELALFSARVFTSVAFQEHEDGLFTKLAPNFQVGDFLEDSLLDQPPFEGDYDFVLMNPPYVQTSDPSNRFASSASRDLYAFFLERALLTSKGIVAVTPQSFTNGARHADLRQVFMDKSTEARIYCFDNVPDTIFRGFKFGSENTNRVNSTRAAISITHRTRESSAGGNGIWVTPLLRWRASERAEMLASADSFLTEPPGLSEQLFPKVMPGLEERYRLMLSTPQRLSDISMVSAEGPTLSIPTTPRYFISATRRTLSRSSQVVLSFADEDLLRLAYLTLNSSLSYFWWRTRDGGMTLSKETLMSIPIDTSLDPRSKEADSLVAALRRSETVNLVTKVNAGKANENVKHPLSLIKRLNHLIAPDDEEKLISLHMNSVVAKETA